MPINKRIVQLLNELNIEQQELAQQIGVSKTTISKIVNGEGSAGAKVIIGILSTYPFISAEWLIRGKGRMLLISEMVESKAGEPTVKYSDLAEKKIAEIEEIVQGLEDQVKLLKQYMIKPK